MPATWERATNAEYPPDAIPVGREPDGMPLYAARAAHGGGVFPGKARTGFGGANIAFGDREVTVRRFEVLVGPAAWAAARDGAVPAGAIPCGHDADGTPLYLVRAPLGAGLQPGHLRQGAAAASIPYGQVAVAVREYEVLVDPSAAADGPPPGPLLTWDFENVLSDRGVSVSVGVPAAPDLVSGFASQTGGGPAEHWGENGTVFLTRFLGTHDAFLWVTLTRPVVLTRLTFRHWHNHNPGFPTCPEYAVQLQVDVGTGYQDVGPELTLGNANSGQYADMPIGRHFPPGGYRFRWHPRRLRRGRDTNTEFFAIKNLRLEGYEAPVGTCPTAPAEVAGGDRPRAPTVTPQLTPTRTRRTRKTARPAETVAQAEGTGYVTLTLGGVVVARMAVMPATERGTCVRSGEEFAAGAVIAFKAGTELTDAQKRAAFGGELPGDLAVLLTPEEVARSGYRSGAG